MQGIDAVLSDLWNRNEHISAISIINISNNSILYQTDNWDISPDLQRIQSAWDDHGAGIEVQGIHYSILQSTPERLVCTNVGGQGHIAASKEGNLLGIAYFLPYADLGASYMDVARVVRALNKKK